MANCEYVKCYFRFYIVLLGGEAGAIWSPSQPVMYGLGLS